MYIQVTEGGNTKYISSCIFKCSFYMRQGLNKYINILIVKMKYISSSVISAVVRGISVVPKVFFQ